jgi:hypothetical protein
MVVVGGYAGEGVNGGGGGNGGGVVRRWYCIATLYRRRAGAAGMRRTRRTRAPQPTCTKSTWESVRVHMETKRPHH